MNDHRNFIYNNPILEISQMSSTGEWVKKFWYVHTINNYSAMKRNGIFIQTRMDQKTIMVSKKNKTKIVYCTIQII